MLIPHPSAWTPRQRWLIVASVLATLSAFGTGVYTYERYHRGPSDSVFFGTWQMEGLCMDCTFYLRLQPDHNVVGFGETDPDFRWPAGHGRWYAGGELLVIHFVAADETAQTSIMRIVGITPDVIRLRLDGYEVRMLRAPHEPPQASNQTMERTADRFALNF